MCSWVLLQYVEWDFVRLRVTYGFCSALVFPFLKACHGAAVGTICNLVIYVAACKFCHWADRGSMGWFKDNCAEGEAAGVSACVPQLRKEFRRCKTPTEHLSQNFMLLVNKHKDFVMWRWAQSWHYRSWRSTIALAISKSPFNANFLAQAKVIIFNKVIENSTQVGL